MQQRRIFKLKKLFQPILNPIQFAQHGWKIKHRIWFEVPTLYSKCAAVGDAFFIIGFALAYVLDENLDFENDISDDIKMKIPEMKKYYSFVDNQIQIRYRQKSVTPYRIEKVAQFFSLGVDSFYTLLRSDDYDLPSADFLIFIQGFDIPIQKTEFLETVKKNVLDVASKTNSKAVFVKSNLREVTDHIIGWGQFHVCALAAVGSLLPFSKIYISGETYQAEDWGLRYGADEVFSHEHLQFKLVAHNITRDIKIKSLRNSSQFDLFLKYVRTCWLNVLEKNVPYNCTACQKCLRTMLVFIYYDIPNPPTFKKLDLQVLSKIVLNAHMFPEWQIMERLLRQKKNVDPKLLEVLADILKKPLSPIKA